ncbi:MAG: ribosome maturation factor [Acidobacteria bacterium]|nr:MAG: ribosome maturation factor [Acidobacteriota bacterium]
MLISAVCEVFPSGPVPTFCFSRVIVTARPEQFARLRDAAERVARSHGLEIFDVQLRREPIGMVLRVVIDRPATGAIEAPEDSVGIEECQRVSHDLSALLDVEDEFGQQELDETYTLEVSSPGLDRPLRHEGDYRRFEGRLAKLVTSEPIGRQSAFAGRIKGVEEGSVLLEEGRKTHRVPLAKIKRGQLDVEF